MAKIHIENGIISSSADYGLYHGTSEIAKVEASGLRVQGDVTAENLIVSSSVTYMTQSFSSGSTIFGDTPADDTHQFTGSVSITGSGGLSVTDGNILSHGQYAIDIDGDHTGGPRITMGDYDSTPDNFMLFGAFSSINNILTQARDFRIYDSGGYTGFYFDVSENRVGIGTTSPSNPLHVSTGDNVVAKFESTDANATLYLVDNSTSNASTFKRTANDLKILENGGNVLFPGTNVKVSGSSTSTGSFGQGYFNARVGIDAVDPDVSATALDQLVVGYPGVGGVSTGTNHAGIVIGTGNTHVGRISFLDTPGSYGGAIDYHHAAGAGGVDVLGFYTDGFTRRLILEGNKISGSLASTGSFGVTQTEGIRGLGGTYSNTVLIPDTLKFGNDTDTEFRRRTSNNVEFRMAGIDIVRIDTTGLQVENGSLEVESGNVIVSGNISGSASSTGSFGVLGIGGGSTPGTNNIHVYESGAKNARISIEANNVSYNPSLNLRNNNADGQIELDYQSSNRGDMNFYLDNDIGGALGAIMSLRKEGHVEFIGENQKISGSSTSTGSFGKIELAGHPSITGGSDGNNIKLKQAGSQLYFLQLTRSTTSLTTVGDVSIGHTSTADEALHIKHTEAVIKLEDSAHTGAGYIDFDGGSLQLNTNRNPNTGANENSAKSHAGITLGGFGASSYINLYTAAVANTTGTSRMYISGSGEIGIGTTSPAGKLSVVTTSDTDGTPTSYSDKFFIVGAGGETGGNVFISYDQTNNRGYIGALTPGTAWRNLILNPGGGNVGIGTTNPSQKLTVAGTVSASNGDGGLELKPSSRDAILTYTDRGTDRWNIWNDQDLSGVNNVLRFDTSLGSSNMVIKQSGEVGIGTTSPATELDVRIAAGSGVRVGSASDYYLTLGEEAYSTSNDYVGLKTDYMSGGSDYMILSGKTDGTTYVSAKNGDAVRIRGGGNDSGNEIIVYDSGVTDRIDFDTTTAYFNGKVGIGETSPSDTLHVVGDTTLDGDVEILANHTLTFTEGASSKIVGPLNQNFVIESRGNSSTEGISLHGADGSGIEIDKAGNVSIADTKTIGTSTFVSGITGDGFRIDDNGSDGTFLEVDNIFVRNTLRTHIFQKDVVKATNGILFISDSGVVSGSSNSAGTVTFENSKSATFNDNDILLFKDVPDQGAQAVVGVRFQINGSGTVGDGSNGVQSGHTRYNVDNVDGDLDNINVGGTAARISGGTVAIDASSTHSPFIDVNASSGSAVMRMGKLTGITSPVFGTLSGFGIWASGSAYFEGKINATTGGVIAGWDLNANSIEKVNSNGGVKIDSSNKRIDFLSDASTTRLRVGQVDSNKFGIRGFNDNAERVFEISETRNEIAGWEITPGNIQSDNTGGSVALSATSQSLQIFTGSIDFARPKVVVGDLPTSGDASTKRYGFGVFTGTVDADITADNSYNVLITRDKAKLAGWDLIPGNIQSDNAFGSVRLSSISQSLAIWTGSINDKEPKLVLGKLPLHDGTVDSPYGFAVFSGTGTVSGSEASASVLITANKARLAGWELIPGRLSSGTVADINGNNASIALGTGATSATGTPTDGLFFVSASAKPVFYVGSTFSYVDDVLTAGGWKIAQGQISSSNGNAILSGSGVLSLGTGTHNYKQNNRTYIDGPNNRMSIGTNFYYESNTLNVGAWTLGSAGLQDGGGVVIGTTGANRFGIAIDDDDDAVNFWRRDRDDGRVEFSVGTTSQFIKYDSAASTAVEINTKSFFLGNATTSFVSGSNNLVEISSSNFHLDRAGNVDMTGTVSATAGSIGGFTLANDKMESNTTDFRGIKLIPNDKIAGFGNTNHKNKSSSGLFAFGVASTVNRATL